MYDFHLFLPVLLENLYPLMSPPILLCLIERSLSLEAQSLILMFFHQGRNCSLQKADFLDQEGNIDLLTDLFTEINILLSLRPVEINSN